MGIQKDAGELLILIYQYYGKSNFDIIEMGPNDFNETGWEEPRVRKALAYLRDKKMVSVTHFAGGNYIVTNLYPLGIDIIENEPKFEEEFGFSINLGVVQFSWSSKK